MEVFFKKYYLPTSIIDFGISILSKYNSDYVSDLVIVLFAYKLITYFYIRPYVCTFMD